jgi:putative phosphoesterase
MSDLRDGPGKIWVVSDTHLRSGQILPDSFTTRVGREDIIIHLGDFISPDIVNQFRKLARLEAVSGNCDPLLVKNQFQGEKIVRIADFRIALTHGRGGPAETFSRVKNDFKGKVDVVLFGHTHVTHHSKSDGTLFFNPGSMTQSRKGPGSFGLLHLEIGGIWGEIFEV